MRPFGNASGADFNYVAERCCSRGVCLPPSLRSVFLRLRDSAIFHLVRAAALLLADLAIMMKDCTFGCGVLYWGSIEGVAGNAVYVAVRLGGVVG